MSLYKNLLLAVDLYENFEVIMQDALRLQAIYQAKLSVVYVSPHITSSLPYAYNFQATIKEQADKHLQKLQADYHLSAAAVFMREGNPKEEITTLAKELGADLIICGSHGKHGLELILGSTANGILHLAHSDVLTLRIHENRVARSDLAYKNIVLATDLQKDNLPVVRKAKALSAQYKAHLHLIHVVGDVASLGYYPPIELDLKSVAEKALADLVQTEQLEVSPQQLSVKIGFPKEEILALAKTVKAELIVLGSHGHKGLASALLGSTANAVLHGAHCDILTVRI